MKGSLWTKIRKSQRPKNQTKKKNVPAIVNLADAASGFGYKLVKTNRRTLSVEIKNGNVIVRSPLFLPKSYIERFLLQKQKWVINKIHSSKKRELFGSLFLGREYSVEYGDNSEISDRIFLKVLGDTKLEKDRALEKFYRYETLKRVEKYLAKYSDQFTYGSVKYRKYSSKWGSCSHQNNLQFNIYLSMCPEEVIEYVVVHELCHTLIKNHQKKFYALVSQFLPNYKKPLSWLRKNRGLI